MPVSDRMAFFINSALAFASAQLLTAALHEAGHGLVAQALGFAPRIYAFYEDNPNGTPAQSLAILAAGPIVSLLLGAGFWVWARRAVGGSAFARLSLAWMALLGVMGFVNYLIVTPWLADGDTAQIANILGWPTAARYGVMLAGVAMVIALARPAKLLMCSVASRATALDTPRAQRAFVLMGFYLPLIAGIVLTAVAGIGGKPLNVVYGLLAAFGNLDIIGATMSTPIDASSVGERADVARRIEPVAIGVYVVLVLFYIFALSRGGVPV